MKVQAVSTIGQFLYRVNLKVFQAYLVETVTDEEMSQDAVMGIIGSLFQFLVENGEGDLALVSLVLWTILGMKWRFFGLGLDGCIRVIARGLQYL